MYTLWLSFKGKLMKNLKKIEGSNVFISVLLLNDIYLPIIEVSENKVMNYENV